VKVLVPVKQVAALDDDFELLDDGSGVDPDFVQTELNEWDSFSLEAALQLREAGDDDAAAFLRHDQAADPVHGRGHGVIVRIASG